MLSVKQGGIKYHFLSLWYDSSRDWTPVSRVIGIFISLLFQFEILKKFIGLNIFGLDFLSKESNLIIFLSYFKHQTKPEVKQIIRGFFSFFY